MNAILKTGFRIIFIVAIFFIAGCAINTRAKSSFYLEESRWQGRLAVTVHSTPPQAFTADFDLQGTAQAGSLTFFTPLGSTVARISWDAGGAILQTTGEPQSFESLDALTRHLTGAALPIGSLFAWLQGRAPTTPEWLVDLRDLPAGRFTAQRVAPETPAELKVILDR